MGGCCCSCLKGTDGPTSAKESEMTSNRKKADEKAMSISAAMSAPGIECEMPLTVGGYGLALAAVSIEQDAAYWEWHVQIPDGESKDIMFGLASKKNAKFYKELEESDGDESPQTNGTALMKKVPVQNDDTLGVAVQQSDLPMVQFLVNGEPMHELAINRFRGAVYPSIYLPPGEDIKATLVFDEKNFRQYSPHARFGPVILATSLI